MAAPILTPLSFSNTMVADQFAVQTIMGNRVCYPRRCISLSKKRPRNAMSDHFRDLVEVDRVIHEPARLIIMAILSRVNNADFLFLLQETGLTRGNLSTHLYRLEQAGYLEIEKGFRGRVSQTNYRLTEIGSEAYAAYREHLKRMVQAMNREDK